jgi:hypothetical protein
VSPPWTVRGLILKGYIPGLRKSLPHFMQSAYVRRKNPGDRTSLVLPPTVYRQATFLKDSAVPTASTPPVPAWLFCPGGLPACWSLSGLTNTDPVSASAVAHWPWRDMEICTASPSGQYVAWVTNESNGDDRSLLRCGDATDG